MLAKLLLCVLVTYVAAQQYAWKPNIRYTYKVYGRTLSGLNEHDPTMSGIFIKADFIVVPKTGDVLTAKVKNVQYSPVQTEFEDGWDAEVDPSELKYQPLQFSDEAFEIHLKNGIVYDIIASKDTENWQVNMIKAIVSQIQLNVNGVYTIESPITTLPKKHSTFGVFKVMEKTVTGEFETSYVMKPEGALVWPILANEGEDRDTHNILISKYKNYSAHGILAGYHYGFANLGHWEPNTEKMGTFMNRSSTSEAVIFGTLDDYTIKSSNTTNEITFSPQFNNGKSGMIGSSIGIVYHSMEPGKPFDRPHESISVGIIYEYDKGFETTTVKGSKDPERVEGEEDVYDRPVYERLNSIRSKKSTYLRLDESELPLDQPPHYPTAPIYNGYKGKSIKYSDKVNVVEDVQKIAREIAEDIEHPNDMVKKSTVNKFSIIVRLVRIMDKTEMDKATQMLYTTEKQGHKTDAWKAYRDAVAQSGTGPALLTIRDWIHSGKIEEEEAAEVFATAAYATRYPTPNYLKEFGKLVHYTIEKKLETLNDTAIMSYGDLLYKVCVNEEYSYQQYPFHTYGSFYTTKCQQIVEEYVKYLEGRLDKAVEKSDSHKILVYVRGLGNVGHRDIYRPFKKYLEYPEDKDSKYYEITSLQRFAIVAAMNRFTRLYPKVAEKIMVNVYFSSAEEPEIRSLAVVLISYTKPEATILSAMAQYTDVDKNEYTNAAVKHMITKLAKEGYEPAIQALPLISKKEYGVQFPQYFFYKYVVDEMNLKYYKDFKTIGTPENMLPTAASSYFKVSLGEAKYTLAHQRVFISSLTELLNAFEQQTEYYHDYVIKKSSHLGGSEHSSDKIYNALSMNIEEREQLEGFVRIAMGEAERSFTMNNYTIDNITEYVREWEHQLKGGKKISATKWLMKYEAILSAPTEMGLPYVFNNEVPTLLRVDGNVKAEALPEISTGSTLRKPENVKANFELDTIFSKNSYSAIRFYTPFDHQDYSSGYDKKMQVYLPIKADVKVDLKTKEATATIKATKPESDIKLYQYHTIPYNVRRNILNLKPSSQEPHYKILTQQTPNVETIPFGHKSVGMTFQFYRETDGEKYTLNEFLQQVERHGIFVPIYNMYFDSEILYSKTEISYKGSESANREVKFRFRYMNYHTEEGKGSKPSAEEFVELPTEQKERLETIGKKASAEIKSATVTSGDMHVEFTGHKEVTIHVGGSYARSPVDKKSRVVAYYRKESKDGEIKPYYFGLVQTGETPNTNGLNFDFAMKFDPTIKSTVHIATGEDKKNLAKVDIDAKFKKTHERVKYLETLPITTKCRKEIQEGNTIMSACANMTSRANLLDDTYVRVQHTGLSKGTKRVVQKFFDMMRPCRQNEFEFEHLGKQDDGTVELKLRFSPDLRSANYSAEGTWATNIYHTCNNIPIGGWERQIFVLHPVFRLDTRLASEAFKIDTYRPVCSVDKTKTSTFDDTEYDTKLTNDWTVMFHHLPQYSNQSDKSDLEYRTRHQILEHVVLVRNGGKGKEVKVTVRSPKTDEKVIEVELKPTGETSPRVKVLVDKKEVKYDQHHSEDFYDRAIRVYGLPNDEVKVEIEDDYYVIADGSRVKLSTTSYKFNNATRGLCGTHNFMEMDDFTLPNGEIEQDSQNFVNAYTLGGQRPEFKTYKISSQYLKLLSYETVRDLTDDGTHGGEESSCTGYQTVYLSKGGQDCFTINSYPTCKPGCRADETKTKPVSFVCTTPSETTSQWRDRVKKGSTINFQSHKANAQHKIDIPVYCKH